MLAMENSPPSTRSVKTKLTGEGIPEKVLCIYKSFLNATHV